MKVQRAGDLIYDEEYGEGHVKISGVFFAENTIMQLDILKDWIESLTSMYNGIIADYEKKH